MRTFLMVMLSMMVSGCFGAGNDLIDDATLCDRTAAATTIHSAALAEDGQPRSRSTGRTLIALLDAGCGRRTWQQHW